MKMMKIKNRKKNENNSGKKKSGRKKVIVAVCCAAFVLAAGLGIAKKFGSKKAVEASTQMSATAEIGDVSTTITSSGSLAGKEESTISLPVGIKIKKVLVSEGDVVKKGTKLASVYPASVAEVLLDVREDIDDLEDDIDDLDDDDIEDSDTDDYLKKLAWDQELSELKQLKKQLETILDSGYITASKAGIIGSVNVSDDQEIGSESSQTNTSDAGTDGTQTASADEAVTGTQTASVGQTETGTQTASAGQTETETGTQTASAVRTGTVTSQYHSVRQAAFRLASSQTEESGTVEASGSADGDSVLGDTAAEEATTEEDADSTTEAEEEDASSDSGSDADDSSESEEATTAEDSTEDSSEESSTTSSTSSTSSDTSAAGDSSATNNAGQSTQPSSGQKGTVSGAGMGGSVSGGGSAVSASSSTEESIGDFEMKEAFTLNSDKAMIVSVSIDEADIESVKKGQSAQVTLTALSDQTFTGEITDVSNVASESTSSVKYAVEITIDKTEDMLAGMSASAVINIEEAKDVVVIPSAAIHEKGGKAYVYTEKDSDDSLSGEKEVTTGLSDGSRVQITEGLNEGDTVYYEIIAASSDGETSMENMHFDHDGGFGNGGNGNGGPGGMNGAPPSGGGPGGSN